MKIEDISEKEFNLWKHHPVTEIVLQFLADMRKVQLDYLLSAWEDGTMVLSEEKEIRGRTSLMKEMTELQYKYIAAFYGVEQDATEVNPDGTSQVRSGSVEGY